MAEEEAPTTSLPAIAHPDPSPTAPPAQQPQQPQEEQQPAPPPIAPLPLAPTTYPIDTEMGEAAPSPAPQAASTMSTPAPQRTATPNRNVNGNVEVAPPMPVKASSHGAPARRYLNERVTGVLLQGMKRLAAEQPEDPLRVLGEYLLQRSKDLEGL